LPDTDFTPSALNAGGLKVNGVEVTATPAELNLLDGSVAGTAVASKALALGANKNVDVLAVADLKLGAGAGTSVTSTAAELNILDGALVTAAELNLLDNADCVVKVAKIALAAVDTAGGVFSWQNDETVSIIVQRLILDVTTASTGACTLDCGTTAASATTKIDNLIDGLDVNAAAGVFDNVEDQGTNGTSRQKLAAGKWVTGSVASGASAGIVGFAYIQYIVI